MRIVVDTGILVSYVIRPTNQFTSLFDRLSQNAIFLSSEQTLGELIGVLTREKFDRWVSLQNRLDFVRKYIETIEMVEITRSFAASADPKDNKFLDVAVCGGADCIIASDADLTDLHPFMGISIFRPVEFIRHFLSEAEIPSGTSPHSG